MLENNIENDPLFTVVKEIVEPMGYKLVYTNAKNGINDVNITVVIHNGGSISLEDCGKVSRILYTVLSNYYDNRDINLEVSSPGLSRHIKDIYEFNLFKGKRIRVYSISNSVYFHGIIDKFEDNKLTLINVRKGDNKEELNLVKIEQDDIKKAQLEENS